MIQRNTVDRISSTSRDKCIVSRIILFFFFKSKIIFSHSSQTSIDFGVNTMWTQIPAAFLTSFVTTGKLHFCLKNHFLCAKNGVRFSEWLKKAELMKPLAREALLQRWLKFITRCNKLHLWIMNMWELSIKMWVCVNILNLKWLQDGPKLEASRGASW